MRRIDCYMSLLLTCRNSPGIQGIFLRVAYGRAVVASMGLTESNDVPGESWRQNAMQSKVEMFGSAHKYCHPFWRVRDRG